MFLRSLATAACCTLLATATFAQPAGQMGGMKMTKPAAKPLLSPAAKTSVTLDGKTITISYNSPRLKGRTIGTTIVPYGEPWRTGANPATTLITPVNLKIGTLDVPAGTYTLFTLPNKDQWLFIVSKKTGEWGIPYPEGNDLGRTPMTSKPVTASQEDMSISFENTHGSSTQLHVKWGTTDQYVNVKAQ
ncbi:MAG: DUF2911 domain-containing protein [Edaphobacter sp.]